MKAGLALLAAVSALLLSCETGFGWGDDGHKIVATIAWEHLTPVARIASGSVGHAA